MTEAQRGRPGPECLLLPRVGLNPPEASVQVRPSFQGEGPQFPTPDGTGF